MHMTTRKFTSVRGGHRSFGEEGGTPHEQAQVHVSVMPQEAIELLALKDGDIVVDATYGQGGHSALIKKAAKVSLVGIEADPLFAAAHPKGIPVLNANFADIDKVLGDISLPHIDKALFDLGWNRGQLTSGRGFSFAKDEPLNMSYGPTPRSGFGAADILNTWSEKAIADALFGYGEERYARRIARAVVARRTHAPYRSTIEFVETINDAVPAAYRRGSASRRTHPATRSFQALRIAVNNELGAIEQGLRGAWARLTPGGRVVVITFHSIEDRLVKQLFASWVKAGQGRLVVKKPLTPSAQEKAENPAARSAKMRAIEKS